MAIFKILKGPSSRISTSVTPFNEGYAYFTPDNNGFYIDAETESGEQRRFRINESSGGGSADSYAVNATLTAIGWSDGRQTVSIAGLGADANGVLGMPQNITSAQLSAAKEAQMYICGQANGSITVAANGTVPTIDVPIMLIIVSGDSLDDAVTLTLNAGSWNNAAQTLSVAGLGADANGVLGMPQDVTSTELDAIYKAGLYISGQSSGAIVISARDTVPTTNVRIVLIPLS